jgi:hypothetical protein
MQLQLARVLPATTGRGDAPVNQAVRGSGGARYYLWMFRSMGFGVAAAIVTALSMYGSLRHGLTFTPDSWAFWQGSVSLLSGRGYRYLDGHPMIFWPPGFASYLALWQAMFGISVGTLVKAQIAVGAFAAFSWTALALSIGKADRHRLASGVVTALLIAAMVSRSFQSLWANFALFALIPWLLWATVRLEDARTSSDTLRSAALASFALLLMLLTHNSAIAFLPPLLAVALTRNGAVRWPAAAAVLVAPLLWWCARWFLGQLESVAWIGGRFSFKAYVRQLVYGIAEPFGQPVMPGAILVVLVLALIPWRRLSRAQLVAFATSAAACLGLLCVFSLVWIWDGLYQRFTLFFPLILVGLMGTTFLLHTGWLRLVAVIVVVGWAALTQIHLVGQVMEAGSPRAPAGGDVLDTSVLPVHATISPETSSSGRFVLVKPPNIPRSHAEMMQLLETGRY